MDESREDMLAAGGKAGLGREEVFETAEAGVTVSGMAVLTCWTAGLEVVVVMLPFRERGC